FQSDARSVWTRCGPLASAELDQRRGECCERNPAQSTDGHHVAHCDKLSRRSRDPIPCNEAVTQMSALAQKQMHSQRTAHGGWHHRRAAQRELYMPAPNAKDTGEGSLQGLRAL